MIADNWGVPNKLVGIDALKAKLAARARKKKTKTPKLESDSR